MRLLDLFSGIGGFSYAAEKLVGGYETVAFCEMDEFCQKVLKKHWPQVPIFDDVRTLDATRLGRIDIVTGGYPCQPFSQAGRRQGEEDERHLWPEMLRIIKSCQPRYVLAENVAGHVTMGLDQVLTDLEDQGYTTRPIIVPACAKNAPHRRDRVWIIGQLTTNTNDTGNRTSRSNIDQEQQTIEQGWKEQSLFEFSRHDEAMADTSGLRGQNYSTSDKKTAKTSSENENVKSSNSCTSDTGSNVADTESKGLAHSNEREICIPKQSGMDSNEKGNRSKVWSKSTRRNKLSGENVADSECKSIDDTNSWGNNRFKKEKQKTRTTHGSSGGQDVSNSDSHRSETRLSGQIKGQKGNTEKSINGDNRQRGWERSNDKATQQRMGNLDDGISRRLLRHFDREPEHIPRVTSGEKNRAKKLMALGNSIVPQVAAEIFIAIKVAEEGDNIE